MGGADVESWPELKKELQMLLYISVMLSERSMYLNVCISMSV